MSIIVGLNSKKEIYRMNIHILITRICAVQGIAAINVISTVNPMLESSINKHFHI